MAHYTIGAIVYADDEEEAKNAGANVLERICGDEKAFDYFKIYEEDGALRANSAAGKQAMSELMAATKNALFRNLKDLREALANTTDEEIYSDDNHEVRYLSFLIGRDEGPGFYLYDTYAQAVIEPSHLKELLTSEAAGVSKKGVLDWRPDSGSNEYWIGPKAWVVVADVHA